MKKNKKNESILDEEKQNQNINFSKGKSPDKSSLEFITNKKDRKLNLS